MMLMEHRSYFSAVRLRFVLIRVIRGCLLRLRERRTGLLLRSPTKIVARTGALDVGDASSVVVETVWRFSARLIRCIKLVRDGGAVPLIPHELIVARETSALPVLNGESSPRSP